MTIVDMDRTAEKRVRRRPGRPTLSNEELLDTALNLFLDNGFERTSVEGICAVAGMAKRTVYARYPDKTALFKAALSRAIEEWLLPIERLHEAETADFRETLLNLAGLLLNNILSPAGLRLLKLTNSVATRMPEIAADNTRMGTESTLAYLADLFRRRLLAADAQEPDADEAALAFLHLVVGGPASTAAWGVTLDDEAKDRHTRYCVDLFLYGALPRAGEESEVQRLRALLAQTAATLDELRAAIREERPPPRR